MEHFHTFRCKDMYFFCSESLGCDPIEKPWRFQFCLDLPDNGLCAWDELFFWSISLHYIYSLTMYSKFTNYSWLCIDKHGSIQLVLFDEISGQPERLAINNHPQSRVYLKEIQTRKREIVISQILWTIKFQKNNGLCSWDKLFFWSKSLHLMLTKDAFCTVEQIKPILKYVFLHSKHIAKFNKCTTNSPIIHDCALTNMAQYN